MTTQDLLPLDYDLVVVGGASSGLSLVLGLIPYLKTGYLKRILLVEKDLQPTHIPGRSIAINQHTLRYFANIGVPNQGQEINCLAYLADLIEPIKTIITTSEFHEQCLVLRNHKHRNDQLGGCVDLVDLQIKLKDLVEILKLDLAKTNLEVKIDILLGTQVESCELQFDQGKTYRKLGLKFGTTGETATVNAGLVAVANGAKFIKGLTVPPMYTKTIYHQQVGVIADVVFNQDVPCTAIEYFTKHGPIAFLPKDKNSATIAWCYKDKETLARVEPSVQEFANELNRALANIPKLQSILSETDPTPGSFDPLHSKPTVHSKCIYYGEMFPVEPLAPEKVQVISSSETRGYVLNATCLQKMNEPNVVYIGNAAHTLHPVSGQGFNLAVLGIEAFLNSLEISKQAHQEQTFVDLVNVIGQKYNLAHLPVANEVYNRTNTFAREFTSEGSTNNWTKAIGLYHLIAYPYLQDIIVNPSIGVVTPGEFKYIYKLIPVKNLVKK